MPNIMPVDKPGDCKTGTLHASAEEIERVLGFPPNVEDDPDKVEHSWGFTVDGVRCGIWDYKGSGGCGVFSVYDPQGVLPTLFGK